MDKWNKVRTAAAAAGVLLVSQMADELVELLKDGLLTDLIHAIAGLIT